MISFGCHLDVIWTSFRRLLDVILISFGRHLEVCWTSRIWSKNSLPDLSRRASGRRFVFSTAVAAISAARMVSSRSVFVVWGAVFDLPFDCSLATSCVLEPPAGLGSLFWYPRSVLRAVSATAPASTLASCMMPPFPFLENGCRMGPLRRHVCSRAVPFFWFGLWSLKYFYIGRPRLAAFWDLQLA